MVVSSYRFDFVLLTSNWSNTDRSHLYNPLYYFRFAPRVSIFPYSRTVQVLCIQVDDLMS